MVQEMVIRYERILSGFCVSKEMLVSLFRAFPHKLQNTISFGASVYKYGKSVVERKEDVGLH